MRLRSIVAMDMGAGPEAAKASEADAVLLALNDASRGVGSLRIAATNAMPALTAAGKLTLVTVNHPRTQLLRDDLDAIVTPHCAGVLLPHGTEPQDVRDTAVLLREFEYKRDIEPGTLKLFAVIDSARGLLRATEIAEAAPRVAGLVFDSDSYADHVGGRAEEHGPRFAYARGLIVAAARAIDGLPLVSGAHLELRTHAQYGFAGAIVRDPGLAPIANAAFMPTDTAVTRARALSHGYAAARAEGLIVGRVDTDIADASAARKAVLTLHAAGLDGAPGEV
jgi:citrate lyase subunit beta/citryl-CoA lyase